MSFQMRVAASAREVEAALQVVTQCFPNTPAEFFRLYHLHDPFLNPSETFLGLDNHRIVSVVQRYPRKMYIRGQSVRMVGIGNVATLASHRGMGYASNLVQFALRDAEKQDHALAMLFTRIPPFFQNLGFHIVERNEFFIQPVAEAPRGRIEAFDKERDLDQIMELYDRFSAGRTGNLVRHRDYWLGQLHFSREDPQKFRVLYRQGKIVAYVRAAAVEKTLRLMEYAYLESIYDVFALASEVAARQGLQRIRLPLLPEEVLQAPDPVPVGEEMEDSIMIRLLNPELMAGQFSLWDDEPQHILEELFGAGEFTYWQTDFF